jgi:hypothetical protein
MQHRCEQCDREYRPRQLGQRFCSKDCGLTYHTAERRKVMQAYREAQDEAMQRQEEQADRRMVAALGRRSA